ncbi:hypothetical protein V6N12_011999 [Hibiscus sabdariffa]|uniref:Uncharacterized protein n=1 Tax=Hibiscus sabdariffa TaxID=183260 RepID=A0ABR2CGX9_9ROSI
MHDLKKIALLLLLVSALLLSTSMAGGFFSVFFLQLLVSGARFVHEKLCVYKAAVRTRFSLGRHSMFVNRLAEEEEEEVDHAAFEESDKGEGIHERLLRANTKDYGKYDPTPALAKPPFKLIPN